jgi:hypothetical protein
MSQLSTRSESSYPGIRSPLESPQKTALAGLSANLDGEAKLTWAATRLDQKISALDDEASSLTRLGYLRARSLGLLGAGGIGAFATLELVSSLPIGAFGALMVISIVVAGLGLASAIDDLWMMLRHSPRTPQGVTTTYFRAVTRGDHALAHRLVTKQDHSGVVRPIPKVPGTTPRDSADVTFDTAAGFAGYWEETISNRRPEGWEDSHSLLTDPVRWTTWRSLKVRRINRRMAIVCGELVWHHVPHWTGLSALFGLLPALFFIPKTYRTVRVKVTKVVVQSKGSWFLVNGELISAEDLVATRLRRDSSRR